MGNLSLADMADRVAVILEDTGHAIFSETPLSLLIQTTLDEVSPYEPRVVKESRLLAADDREVDLSEVVGLLSYDRSSVQEVEYPLDYYPRKFRPFNIVGRTLEIEMNTEPEAGDEVQFIFKKAHVLVAPPSSLAGAVNADHLAGVASVTLESLGTGVIKAGTIITFAGTIGEYKVLADATIVANACTVTITPALLEDVANHTVVTFLCNSLTPRLEGVLPEYVAGKAALNWMGAGRTQVGTTVTLLGDINTALDLVTARAAQAVTDIAAGRSLMGDSATQSETALDAIAALITSATGHLTTGATFINALPTYADPASARAQYAAASLSAANTKLNEAQGYISKANLAGAYGGVGARELQTVSSYISQAAGYAREASSRLNIPQIQRNMATWGAQKLAYAKRELEKFSPPVQVFYRWDDE